MCVTAIMCIPECYDYTVHDIVFKIHVGYLLNNNWSFLHLENVITITAVNYYYILPL